MRRQLCDEHVAVENQTAHLEDAMLRRLNKRRLARLAADILLLDRRMAQIVAGNANLTRRYELLTSMQGVGPTLAFTLVALLPELGQMSRKQIAALVGLAPYDFDSGRLKGHRCIYGGTPSQPCRSHRCHLASTEGEMNENNENKVATTLADVLSLVDRPGLIGTRRRDMISAIKRFCEMVGTNVLI
jgi:Transposase IS116/IS110/IS902 family